VGTVRLASLTRPELIFPDLPAQDRDSVLRALAGRIAGLGLVRDAEGLFQKLREREQLGSTGVGAGVAIPHTKLPGLEEEIVAIAMVPEGVGFGAADGQPVRLLFLVLSPSSAPAAHLQVLAAISRWLRVPGKAEHLVELRDPAAVVQFLEEDG
jgi:PTS system nitrogen regulatory IIA component